MLGSSHGVADLVFCIGEFDNQVVLFFQRELDFKLYRSFTCGAIVEAGLTTKSTHAT